MGIVERHNKILEVAIGKLHAGNADRRARLQAQCSNLDCTKTMEERQRCGIILSHIFPRIEELVVPVGEQIAGRLSNWRKNRAAGWRCQCNHQRVHKPVQTIFISATLNVQVQPPLCTQSSAGHRCSIKIDTLARKSENPKIFSKSLQNARKHM